MFDPSKFKAATPMAPALGNSAHPVGKYVDRLTMRWFDKTASVAVVGLKELPPESHYRNCRSVTYRPDDGSIQFHLLTPVELKALWDAKENFDSPYEPISIASADKYVGNAILREIAT